MTVCFIGHRTVIDKEQVKSKLQQTLISLIDKGANIFLFGSRSDFDFLAWEVVSKLKEKYPYLKRICYNTPNETAFTSKEEKERGEQFFSEMLNCQVHYAYYEESVNSLKSVKANKNAYILRNQEMIEHSDVCIFYYDKTYLPPKKIASEHQSNSGTAIAFAFALKLKKTIYNVF